MTEEKLPRGDAAIVERVMQITGFRREESRISYQATVAAIREKIEAGEEVILPGVGRFVFMIAKPRTVPNRRGLPKLTLGERPVLKFKTNQTFKELLKSVKPKNPRKHQRWSDLRKASTLANQILKGESSASPSIQPDTVPSTSTAQEGNNRIRAQNPDTAGTSSAPDCKSDSNGISTGAASEPLSEQARVIVVTPVQREQLLRSSREIQAPPAEAP